MRIRKDKSEKEPSRKKWSWAKGLVGLILLLGVFGGAAYGVIRWENQSRIDDANEQVKSQQTDKVEDCYALPNASPFTSGSPVWDQILVFAIENGKNNKNYQTFVSDYLKEGRLDSKSAVYKDIVSKVNKDDKKKVRPYLMLSPDNTLMVAEDDKSTYEAVMTQHPEALYKSGIYAVEVNVVLDNNKESTETYIMGISQEPGENNIVFPVKTGDNAVKQFEIVKLLPVCK